ncbi:MAG: glycogen/starch/alpha-glucan phosphorylase, partial [Chlamydiota bacterium]|nr:glycogen/starch/alpha-glucan phosphorylase [Chlamydiota bacterium]
MARESDVGIGNGGLGRLASCFMEALATGGYPAMGYGMRYHYGIFEQELLCGVQVERPDNWLMEPHPWQVRRDDHAVIVPFGGRIHEGGVVDAESVRALPYDLPVAG